MTLDQVMNLSDAGFAAYKASVAQLRAIFGDVVWCEGCGWGFTTTRPEQRCCSGTCYMRAWRAREKAA